MLLDESIYCGFLLDPNDLRRRKPWSGSGRCLGGLGRRYPFIGAVLALCILSLAGFPPLGGFVARFFLIGAVVKTGHILTAVLVVLASVIGAYFYLRVLVHLFMRDPVTDLAIPARREGFLYYWSLGTCGVLVILLGLFPSVGLMIARYSAYFLF